jgi:hypothetical protein
MEDQNVVVEPVVEAAPVEKPVVKKGLGIGQGRKLCPKCEQINGAKAHTCSKCQHVFVIKALLPKVARVAKVKIAKVKTPKPPKAPKAPKVAKVKKAKKSKK